MHYAMKLLHLYQLTLLLLVLSAALAAAADCGCPQSSENDDHDKPQARRLKIVAIFTILTASTLGVCLPIAGQGFSYFRPESTTFFAAKAFAAGVILSTGFVHILPEAFERLTSSCLTAKVWEDFPFTGFTAMVAAMATLMVDCFATAYFKQKMLQKVQIGVNEEESGQNSADEHGVLSVHSHATHGHAHGAAVMHHEGLTSELIRHKIVTQVLELGIVVHSIIIGIALGASTSSSTIRPLLIALTFHQLFEGVGLGSCIVQAGYTFKSIIVMILFFSLTTPVGIVIGIGITSSYNEESQKSLIVQGLLDASSAGILIYMALVDLLSADFMHPKVQGSKKLQLLVNIFLLMGSGLMSMLAKWA